MKITTYTLRTADGQLVATMDQQNYNKLMTGVPGNVRPRTTKKGTTMIYEITEDKVWTIQYLNMFNVDVYLWKGMFLAVQSDWQQFPDC